MTSKLCTFVLDKADCSMNKKDTIKGTNETIMSLYGLRVKKTEMSNGENRYYMAEPLWNFAEKYHVYTWYDIEKKAVPNQSLPEVEMIDGPLAPHPDDLKYMADIQKKQAYIEEGHEYSQEEENMGDLYNIYINLSWDDIPFREGGKVGLKDCWGNIIVPAEYDDCNGIHDARLITREKVCISLKKGGKWALGRRSDPQCQPEDFQFDQVEMSFQCYYVVEKGGKYGLYTSAGRQLLPAEMTDISKPDISDGNVLFKQDGKFGILYRNETKTELVDELDLGSGLLLSVRKGNQWGYLDKDGHLTKKRSECFIRRTSIDDYSIVRAVFKTSDDDIDIGIPLEDAWDEIKKSCFRLSVRMDYKVSSLAGKAKVEMGLTKPVLYYTVFSSGQTFCVGMSKPYALKLVDDKYHDMVLSWEGNEEARADLEAWLNERNVKSGIKNWVELVDAYNRFLLYERRNLIVSYAYRKTIDAGRLLEDSLNDSDFPDIVFR